MMTCAYLDIGKHTNMFTRIPAFGTVAALPVMLLAETVEDDAVA